MFTINIKGKRNPKNTEFIKLEIIFYKPGYARVSKALCISGLYKYWDTKMQRFQKEYSEAVMKNKLLQKEYLKYLKIAEKWELEDKNWLPVELSHYYDKKSENRNKYIPVSDMLVMLANKFKDRVKIKNGISISSHNNAKVYLYLKGSLEKFTIKKYRRLFSKYLFGDINETFLFDFILHLQLQGKKNGNRCGLEVKLKCLHSTFIYAKQEGIYNVNLSIFFRVKDRLRPHSLLPKTVSYKAIQKIESMSREKLTRFESLYLDLFLFSYYAGGMSNIDVCFLSKLYVKEDLIIYERIKCSNYARVILIDKAKEIINK